QANQLTVGAHGFTLRLPSFQRAAVEKLAIAVRLPTVADVRGLVSAVVDAASRNGKSGCAAVEDLVCSVTGAASCAGAGEPAGGSAIDTLGARLDAAFTVSSGVDLELAGEALASDSDFDLYVDRLTAGVWMTTGAKSATFEGKRTP